MWEQAVRRMAWPRSPCWTLSSSPPSVCAPSLCTRYSSQPSLLSSLSSPLPDKSEHSLVLPESTPLCTSTAPRHTAGSYPLDDRLALSNSGPDTVKHLVWLADTPCVDLRCYSSWDIEKMMDRWREREREREEGREREKKERKRDNKADRQKEWQKQERKKERAKEREGISKKKREEETKR